MKAVSIKRLGSGTRSMSSIARSQRDQTLRELHKEGRVIDKGYHRVSRVHRIYYEVHGNPNGIPAVVLHGGPGSGCSSAMGRLFDLEKWKVVLFDQRGCGKSVPRGLLFSNYPKKLVGDIERLRYHLDIKKWLVLGGSYGSTLALCYAQDHASRVTGMVLRAVCLMRDELDWLFSSSGIAQELPQEWDKFMSILEPNEQENPIKAYHNRMLSLNEQVRVQAGRYWREWTIAATFSHLRKTSNEKIPVKSKDVLAKPVNMDKNINNYHNRTVDNVLEDLDPMPKPLVQPLIESHYFLRNKEFMTDPYPILNSSRLHRIKDIPCIAVHGEKDPICLPSTAQLLKEKWKEMELRLVPRAGHFQFDPFLRDATIRAIEDMEKIAEEASVPDAYHDKPPSPTYQIPEPFYRKKYR